MASFLFLLLLHLTTQQSIAKLSIADINNLQRDIRARIDTFRRPDAPQDTRPLLATMIRLVFHDCAASTVNIDNKPSGLCNGCINIFNPDHEGLEFGAIYPLEQVYLNENEIDTFNSTVYKGTSYLNTSEWNNPSGTTWIDKMSRADFWAISATLAIEYGIEFAFAAKDSQTNNGELQAIEGWQLMHGIRYFEGREDCETSPFESNPAVTFFANPNWEFDNMVQFFKDSLGFSTTREVIAIMGAHSLGRGHNRMDRNNVLSGSNSDCCGGNGYNGKWKGRDSHVFTNEYYADIYFMRWEQRPANARFDGTKINGVTSRNIQWRNNPSTGEVPTDISANHDGLMLNVDMSLIFIPGLDVTNFTSGIAGCNQWELGCELTAQQRSQDLDCPELVSNPCAVKREPMGINQVPNINVWFESYHLFDTGFYRDFGIVWDKMIRVNNEQNLEYFVERIRPLWTYVGLQNNAPNNPYELPVKWWPDLNNLQLWTLNSQCELVRINETVLTDNGLANNPLNGQFNSFSAYISVYVTRDSSAESEVYDLHLWIGDDASENVKDQMIEYGEKMREYLDDTLWQLDTGWSNREVYGDQIYQGGEPTEFTQHFPNGLTYDNREWTPQCDEYLIPTLDSYIVEYNDSSHVVYEVQTTADPNAEKEESESAAPSSKWCNVLLFVIAISCIES